MDLHPPKKKEKTKKQQKNNKKTHTHTPHNSKLNRAKFSTC